MNENHNITASTAAFSPFIGMLTVAFIVLKLCNVIKWSWVWVLSPLWISAILVLLIFSGLIIYILHKRGGN